MNILIAVPSMDSVPAVFCQSLSMLKKVGDCAVAFQIGSLVYDSRNNLAKHALKMHADYVFWLDSDMMFEPDILERMMATMQEKKLDILSGIYYRRKHPFHPVLFKKLRVDEQNFAEFENFNEYPMDDIFEVEGIGFGCVLMSSEVLFDVAAKYKDWFSPLGRVGEDLSFCWRARQCGYKIFADPTIQLGHCGSQIVTKDFYDAYIKQMKEKEK